MGNRTNRRRGRTRRIGDTILLVAAGIVSVYLFALLNFQIFLWCTEGTGAATVLYLILKIGLWIRRREKRCQQTEIVRDSRYISPQLRQSVWTKCGGKCVQCASPSLLEYDHIIPISKGGATSYGNLQVLCRPCNRHKSDHI